MQECMQKLGIKDSLHGLLAIPFFFVWRSPVSAFLFLKAGAETDEDDRC